MRAPFRFTAAARRFLRTPGQRYPYAYGYLTSMVRGYLDGDIGREQMQAVLDALAHELQGNPR